MKQLMNILAWLLFYGVLITLSLAIVITLSITVAVRMIPPQGTLDNEIIQLSK